MAISERIHALPVGFRNLPPFDPEEQNDYPRSYPNNLIDQDNLLRKRLGMCPKEETVVFP